MHITVDTLIGLVALLSGFGIYFLDVRHKLDTLLERQEGVLSREQADDLTVIYSDLISTHLNEALFGYTHRDLPGHYAAGDIKKIMHEFRRAYDRVVTMSIKPMVKHFRLRGNHRFTDVVERVNKDSLELGFRNIEQVFERAIFARRQLPEAIAEIQDTIQTVNKKGKDLISKEIAILYPRRSDA